MGAGNSQATGILFLIAIFVIFYFLLIRPSQVKQKQHLEMIKNIKKGDRVVTQGGIHGEVVKIKDKVFHLKIADKTEIVIEKSAIAFVKKKEIKKQQ